MRQQFEPADNVTPEGRSTPQVQLAKGRRGFLSWMGRVGLAVVGSVSGVTALSEPAHAGPGCCNLGSSTNCGGSGPGFRCPSGYRKRAWYCASGGRTYGCGECTTGNSCRTGRYACSEVWVA